MARNDAWPALPLDEWEPTYQTLHRWTQMVGKLKLALSPPMNHWWHSSLRFNARGLTTTPMPLGERELEVAFDFLDHQLVFSTSDGIERRLSLRPTSVADFYGTFRRELVALGVDASLWPVPVEVADHTPFPRDRAHCSYERDQVARMWRILSDVHRVFEAFRGRYQGKCSPVQFFWGAFDVAVTRFSGRPNPSPPDDPVMREAYSHEVISHGFWFGGDWPGGGRVGAPVFYAYAVPEPGGLPDARVQPADARYEPALGEFLLPYDWVRELARPEDAILTFMQSTYDAGASLAGWDRAALERAA